MPSLVYGPLPQGVTLGGSGLGLPSSPSDGALNGNPGYWGPSVGSGVIGTESGNNGWSDWEWYLYNQPYNNPNAGFGGYTAGGFGGGDDDGGSGGGYGWGGGGGGGSSGGGVDWTTLAGLGAGALALGGLTNAFGGRSVAQRNLPSEFAGILATSPSFAQQNLAIQQMVNPQLTRLNTSNFNGALGDVSGSLRDAYNIANPAIEVNNRYMYDLRDQLNAYQTPTVSSDGYTAAQSATVSAGPAAQATFAPAQFQSAGQAAQATFTPSQAYTANAAAAQQQRANAYNATQQRATGGPLLGILQRDAGASINRVSPLQSQQQQIAAGLLAQGGNLSDQDQRQVQQDTRAAFAASGLYDSNQRIGSEVMNLDAARRNRLTQNLGIAQGVDAAGQQQIQSNRNYGLGVQNQGQNLSTFNAGQGNALGQFNAGILSNTSQFNAGQGNSINTFNAGQQNDIARFNAGLLTQNSQYNSGLGAQVSQYNAGAQNQMQQFNAAQANALNQYNAGLGAQVSQYNAGALNQMGQYNAGLSQQNNQFNSGATNTAQQYNAGLGAQLGMFNANMMNKNVDDIWSRGLQYGNYQLAQAQNPTPVAMGLMGTSPDYTPALLGYGSDVYNTNTNATNAASISRGNNNAALAAAGINALYQLYGRYGGG